MSRRALAEEEVNELLGELDGWQVVDGKLFKLFKFSSFAQALGWMVSVGTFAEKLDHHPDWSNSYNKVEVQLITHDLGKLSTLDARLARRMEELAGD